MMSDCTLVQTGGEHGASTDGTACEKSLFEPTGPEANDSDDERTLEEEEALAAGEHHDPKAELNSLQREGDMPLDELLAMYGYDRSSERPPSVPALVERPDGLIKTEESPSALSQLYAEPSGGGAEPRCLRSGSRPPSEEEDDGDYSPEEDDWKKTIMVGGEYQAPIPDGLCSYDDVLPYENSDKLLWNPDGIDEAPVEQYMEAVRALASGAEGLDAVPTGRQLRDDEQALYLLQQCGHNVEEALRRRRMTANAPADSMSLWSEEECRNFENGLKAHGKDFHLIRQNKVRTRSVGELVQFYYIWKKTERHDMFANKARLEKKKYTLHPGHTDYMDRFLEEQEAGGMGSTGGASGAGRASPVCLVYAPTPGPQPDPLALGEREVFATLTTSPAHSHSDHDTDHDTSALI